MHFSLREKVAEGPDEGSAGPESPSPAASRHPLPEGEGTTLGAFPLRFDLLEAPLEFRFLSNILGMEVGASL